MIGGGALIVDVLGAVLHERAGVTELVVSEHDILDGIARTIAWRLRPHTVPPRVTIGHSGAANTADDRNEEGA